MLKSIVNAVDFVFPHLCPGCHEVNQSAGLCSACWKQLEWITHPHCPVCGEPQILHATLCSSCRRWLPLFSSHRSLWRYAPLSRKLIFALKYGRERYLAHLFASWLLPLVLPLAVNLLVPVPLHPRRLMQRGFNQSALLAQLLSRMTGIPATVTALRRIGKNRSQRGLSLQKRQENVEGAFVCDADFAHRHLLLIDDVFTTGATLSACVSVLRDAGAERVEALTLMKVTL